jgi:hypothetical protein
VVRGTTKYGEGGGCSPAHLARTGLPERRRESLAKLVNLGLAQKTWSSYDTAERMWRRCEKETGTKMELPWGQRETLLFLDWLLSDRMVSAATASTYLAGVKKIHALYGAEEPAIRGGLVSQILKGKKNVETVEKRQKEDKGRLPVTLAVLELIKEALRASSHPVDRKLLIWAVCTLAFHGSFRIHELLCQQESWFDPDFTLMGRDVQMKTWPTGKSTSTKAIIVTVKSPKENRRGGVALVDVYETGGPTCPVKAYSRWKDRTTADPQGVLFREKDGTPLTGRRFNVLLKQLLEPHVDYSKGQITAHSFRSGVPSLMGALGHSEEEIKKVGRWSSRSFEHYTKLPRTNRAAIAQKLGRI